MDDLNLRLIQHGSDEYELEVELRSKILREPLGLSFSKAELATEQADLHLGAFLDQTLVGCLMLVPQSPPKIKMRQVAVATESQRLGVGKKLIAHAEALALQKGFGEMHLHARESAVPFYLALGYQVYEEPFVEVTQPHRKMKKQLSPKKSF